MTRKLPIQGIFTRVLCAQRLGIHDPRDGRTETAALTHSVSPTLAEPGHIGRRQEELTVDGPEMLGVQLTLTQGKVWRQKLLYSEGQERDW